MNRRNFMRASVAGAALPALASAETPQAPKTRALILRQSVPATSQLFFVQIERQPSPLTLASGLAQLAGRQPTFINASLELLFTAGTCEMKRIEAGRPNEGDHLLVAKSASIMQPKTRGGSLDMEDIQSATMAETTMTFPHDGRARCRQTNYHENACQLWTTGKDTDLDMMQFLIAEKPIHWSWALLLTVGGTFNAYFSERLKILDNDKGLIQFKGNVVSLGFDGVDIVDLAQAELPQASVLIEYDETHSITHFTSHERADMIEALLKGTH